LRQRQENKIRRQKYGAEKLERDRKEM